MEKTSENPFAAVIRQLRANTPQGVFADMLGIKQAKYSHYENRRREPSLDELCRIARALNTTPNVLLGFDDTPPIPSITTGDNSPIAIGSNITQAIQTAPNAPIKRSSKNLKR